MLSILPYTISQMVVKVDMVILAISAISECLFKKVVEKPAGHSSG